MSGSSSFTRLHPLVQKWIWDQGWNTLLDIQENTIPYMLNADCDIIVSASTGGGKTEAVFLPILTKILENGKSSGFQVLYVSPLKALINDQYRRLIDMTKNMPVDVTPWHGDISASLKNKAIKNPNGILIITPESLEAMMMNRKQTLPHSFSGLRYVVLDEFHSFLGEERGKQLQSLLSRLENVIGRRIPRIAMSATLSDFENVASFLRPDRSMPCSIPDSGISNHEIQISLKEYIGNNNRDINDVDSEICSDIYNKLRGTNNLIFANSRVDVENLAINLSSMCEVSGVPNEFRVHHGNISKTERESVEHELLEGAYPVSAVCTCTLELGIDIGKVKSIAQIYSCSSVSDLRQRLGRSGRRGDPSLLRIYSYDKAESSGLYDDLKCRLIQNIAVVELIREKKYEPPCVAKYHFSTLIQQILSCLTQFGGFTPKDGWILLCKNGAFRNVTSTMFLDLLRSLGEKKVVSTTHNGLVVVGEVGEKIIGFTDFYAAFQSDKEISVIDQKNGKEIGTVQSFEEVGHNLLLGGRRWIVLESDAKVKRIMVRQVKDGGRANYMGEGAPIDRIITEKMREVLLSYDIYPYLDKSTEAVQTLCNARTFFRENHLDRPEVVIGGEHIMMTWAGEKINNTLSLAVLKLLGKKVKHTFISIELSMSDVDSLLEMDMPQAVDLASILGTGYKQAQKYDNLLPENLLNLEFGESALDVMGAWEILSWIKNRNNMAE